MKIKRLVQLAVLATSVAPMASCKLMEGHKAIAVMAARTKVDHNGHDVAVFSYSLTPSNTTENDIRVKLEWKEQDAVGDVYDYLSAEIDHDRQEFSVTKLADFDQVATATIYSFAHPGISASTEIHLSEKFLGYKNSYQYPLIGSHPVIPVYWEMGPMRPGVSDRRLGITGWVDFLDDATNGFSSVFTDSISHELEIKHFELIGEMFDWYDPDDEIEDMNQSLVYALENAFDIAEEELFGDDSPYWNDLAVLPESDYNPPYVIGKTDHTNHWAQIQEHLTDAQLDILDEHNEGIEAKLQYDVRVSIAGHEKGISFWLSYYVSPGDYQTPVE